MPNYSFTGGESRLAMTVNREGSCPVTQKGKAERDFVLIFFYFNLGFLSTSPCTL